MLSVLKSSLLFNQQYIRNWFEEFITTKLGWSDRGAKVRYV